MHLIKLHRSLPKIKNAFPRYSTNAALELQEYTETPEYPPILDLSREGRILRERQKVHNNIQALHTVEEKQIAMNMPRYYGWKCVMLNEDKVPYNAMPMVQHYTRTHFVPVEKLPEAYNESEQEASNLVKDIKNQIEDAIAIELGLERNYKFETHTPEEIQKENAVTKCIVRQINRIIMNNLSERLPHILSTQVDYDARHEAFWFVGGVDPSPSTVKWRKDNKKPKSMLYESLDRPVQYIGSPLLTLRNRNPLKPLIPHSEAENPAFKVEKFTTIPGSVGYIREFRHGTNIPGYWPGDIDEFGLLSYHGRGHILARKPSFGEEDNIEALHCQAMKASFGWLLAQANYQGFTTFNDLTYPLVTQTVITNGKFWSLYAYQLNTIVMHNDVVDSNPKHNICFGTKPIQLYDKIENEKVLGLNEDVLKMLLQFYMNVPAERNYELKPYLGKEEKVVADIEDDKRRCWLEDRYKHLVSNRPKHNLLPEFYLWEKIYKIQYNTRFFEAKRRPFEKGVNPFHRRLDEHLPPYIPKVLRPYPKSKKKFETTYYPEV